MFENSKQIFYEAGTDGTALHDLPAQRLKRLDYLRDGIQPYQSDYKRQAVVQFPLYPIVNLMSPVIGCIPIILRKKTESAGPEPLYHVGFQKEKL